jgi:hypothetical protein
MLNRDGDSNLGRGEEFFSSPRPDRLSGPPSLLIQWIPGALSLGQNGWGGEADHSPPSSAKVKNAWSYTFTPPLRLHSVVLS